MREDRRRLLDIVEAAEKIERYAALGQVRFAEDELIQTWMVYHLQTIGEAVRELSEDLRGRYPDIPWRAIAAMRHVLVHAYFRVDLDEVWNAVHNDVPALKARVGEIPRLEPE